MNETSENKGNEEMSARFAQMVVQQANMALMLMGKTPHPQTGQSMHDLEGARMFIDQLEMLQAKTVGNLNKQEEMLLKQSLMSLQLAFVEAAETAPASEPAAAPAAGTEPAAAPSEAPAESSSTSDETKKKFTKKY